MSQSSPYSLPFLQGSHSLAYKKLRTFPGFSRTPKTFFQDSVIAQQCFNICTDKQQLLTPQCETNKQPPQKLFAISSLLRAKCISVKFGRFVANFYPNIYTNFGYSNLIFNKMALIFLRVLIVFTISCFELHKVKLP